MSTASGTPPVPQKAVQAHPLHWRMLIATAIAAVLIGSSATAAVNSVYASPRPAVPRHTSTGFAARSSHPDRADWEKIKNAARLRTIALAPHRTAHFRSFAAYLGLRELVSIHPIAPGRCAAAVTYLYNNLRDLENAYPGENWTPLRRAVAKEPSIDACAPQPSKPHHPRPHSSGSASVSPGRRNSVRPRHRPARRSRLFSEDTSSLPHARQ